MTKNPLSTFLVGLALACSLFFVLAIPAFADDVYVFYSLANRELWESLEPALSTYEIETYKVDLLTLADYSAKQKAVARANRSHVSIVVGPKASHVLSDTTLVNPLIAVEARDSLQTKAKVIIYLYFDRRPPVMVVPQKIRSVSDVENLSLQTITAFQVDAEEDMGAIVAAVVEKMAPRLAKTVQEE